MHAFKSSLFRGDPHLAACAVNHAKHIALGARGPHVTKIQCAVLMLNGGTISGLEIVGKHYGPSTAAAVLAYKTRRSIINRSYQSQPDNIVGIMTVQALDAEMALAELHDIHVGVRA
jgi:peptidoglycan hydrolase-like protein with peptidoglycan-binding domain